MSVSLDISILVAMVRPEGNVASGWPGLCSSVDPRVWFRRVMRRQQRAGLARITKVLVFSAQLSAVRQWGRLLAARSSQPRQDTRFHGLCIVMLSDVDDSKVQSRQTLLSRQSLIPDIA